MSIWSASAAVLFTCISIRRGPLQKEHGEGLITMEGTIMSTDDLLSPFGTELNSITSGHRPYGLHPFLVSSSGVHPEHLQARMSCSEKYRYSDLEACEWSDEEHP